MSESQSPISPEGYNLNYETPPRYGNAPTLVRLAGIFSLVSAGIDLIYGACMVALVVVMYYAISRAPAAAFAVAPPAPVAPVGVAPLPPPLPPAPVPILPETATAPTAPVAPGLPAAAPVPPAPAPVPPLPRAEIYMMLGMYGGPGILSLLVMVPKIIGAVKLFRRGRRAWGWGLATGIIGCTQLWMFMPCCVPVIIPVATGIYTIVIVCLPHVRIYIAAGQTAARV